MKIKNLLSRVPRLSGLTVKSSLIGVLGLLCVMLLVGAWMGLGGMARANESMRQIYEEQLVPLAKLDTVARGSLRDFIALSEATFHKDEKSIVKQKLDDLKEHRAASEAMLKELGKVAFSPELKKQMQAFQSARDDMQSSLDDVVAGLEAADGSATEMLYSNALPNVAIVSAEIDKLVKMQEDASHQRYEEAVASYERVRS